MVFHSLFDGCSAQLKAHIDLGGRELFSEPAFAAGSRLWI
jgi:hypothetical protein